VWKINLKLFFAILTASIALVCVAGFTMAQTQLPERIYQHFFAPSSEADVEVLATPIWSGRAPTVLIVTFVTANETALAWTKGASQNNTMIRVGYNAYPETINDGYLLYQGTGNITGDYAPNLDEYFGMVYYRAWGDNSTDGWSETYVSASLENPAVSELVTQMITFNATMTFFTGWLPQVVALLILTGLIAVAYWRRIPMIYAVAGLLAVVYGFVYYNTGATMGIGIVVFGIMTFIMAFWDKGEKRA